MTKFIRGMLLGVFLICVMLKQSFAQEQLVVTSYYPSPMGVYSEIRLVPKSSTSVPCNGTYTGLMYYDSTAQQFGVCTDFGGGVWQFGLKVNRLRVEAGGLVVQSAMPNALIVIGNTQLDGHVGVIGNIDQTGNLNVLGNLGVSGTFNAAAKFFKINHPVKPGLKLVHASIEGPEVAVFYRGQSVLSKGKAIVALPDYFEALTRKDARTVTLTSMFDSDEPISELAASVVSDGKFTVRAIDNKNPGQKFYWEVKAVRADVEPLRVETAE